MKTKDEVLQRIAAFEIDLSVVNDSIEELNERAAYFILKIASLQWVLDCDNQQKDG